MSTATAIITTQEVKAVQETLGQFLEQPWHDYDKIAALPAEGLEILAAARRQLRPLIAAAAATPELQDRLEAGAAGLEALHGELGGCESDAAGSYPLTAAQIRRFIRIWDNLEGARRALAVTLLDRLEPYMGVIDTGEIQPGGLNLSVDTHRKYRESLQRKHRESQQRKRRETQ